MAAEERKAQAVTLYAYQGMRPDLSARIDQADESVQRQIARELTIAAVRAVSTPRGEEGLAAVVAEQFGESGLRTTLATEAATAEDRYMTLRDQREDAEEADEDFAPESEVELDQARRTARLYQLLVDVLSDDAVHAAQQAAYLSRAVLVTSDVDHTVQRILDEARVGQTLGYPQGWV